MAIKVKFSAMDKTVTALNDGVSQIGDVLDRLGDELDVLSKQWVGAAATAYRKAQGKWAADMTDLATQLGVMSSALACAKASYSLYQKQLGAVFS